MTHFLYIPLLPPHFGSKPNNPYRLHGTPLPQPPPPRAAMTASESVLSSSTNRSGSVCSSSDQSSTHRRASSTACAAHVPSPPACAIRRTSTVAARRHPRGYNSAQVKTRSLGFGAGVVFEREFTAPPRDEDVIVVSVRLRNQFRKGSIDGCDELPSRPIPRSFLRRLSTRMAPRLDHSADREDRYKAVKMPRGEYKRFFARDKHGNYAGTEPEREWDESDLLREYGEFQDVPVHYSILR